MSGCPEWLRQHRMRLDWQTIIKSCYDNMAWEKVKRGWEKAYITNASASEIIFQDIRPAEGYSKIFIQSKTSELLEKPRPSSIAVTVFDHGNGTNERMRTTKMTG